MEWTTAASLVARTATQGYNHRYTIQKYWTKAKAFIDVGATQILVTGNSAAGKTLLAGQMHGRARELGFQIPPESRTVEVEAITPGQWSKLVRILPGQVSYRTQGEIDHLRDNPYLEGIIHVVDYGYTCPRDPSISRAMIENDLIDTIDKLRERNLRLEIDSLQILLSDVRKLYLTNKTPKWMLIVVNKVDLFPSQRDQALLYYHPEGNSEFSKALSLFQRDVGNNNIHVYVAQACAYESDFNWNGITVQTSLQRREQDNILLELMNIIAIISEDF